VKKVGLETYKYSRVSLFIFLLNIPKILFTNSKTVYPRRLGIIASDPIDAVHDNTMPASPFTISLFTEGVLSIRKFLHMEI
jgi:hypothetical protein